MPAPLKLQANPVRVFKPEDVRLSSTDPHAEEQRYRAATYSILAALLRDVPTALTLEQVAQFAMVAIDEDELLLAMSSLGLAVQNIDEAAIAEEYHDLFIGLGRGEIVPYGSWYITGYLMEQPLSRLRDDLQQLGFERATDTNEPEDHIAALCEVMSMLITDAQEMPVQSHFFEHHISAWCERFFSDLENAKSASFYQSVGRFGSAFMSIEKQYLRMSV